MSFAAIDQGALTQTWLDDPFKDPADHTLLCALWAAALRAKPKAAPRWRPLMRSYLLVLASILIGVWIA